MDCIGIDVHKRDSQVCIVTEGGELIEKRIRTSRHSFGFELGSRSRARVLIEASTESEWVARCLEELGHEVVVADPNFAPMYASRTRKIKTDRRDARALLEACRLGAYRPAHRLSETQRHVRAHLAVRDALVRTRARYISVVRSLLRREGLRVRAGNAKTFLVRLHELDLPTPLREEIAPAVEMMGPLNEQIRDADKALARITKCDDIVTRLCTVPGVGLVTAAAFVATIDHAGRFARAHQVEAYLGLVPREMSSGERQPKGRITKSGNSRARCLLVEAAWSILRYDKPETAALRHWAERIASRRGKSRAVVALARRLAGIHYALMRDGTVYQWEMLQRPAPRPEVA